MTEQKPEWEVRMDRIDATLGKVAESQARMEKEREEDRKWMRLLSQTIVDLARLRVLEYEGPWESEPATGPAGVT